MRPSPGNESGGSPHSDPRRVVDYFRDRSRKGGLPSAGPAWSFSRAALGHFEAIDPGTSPTIERRTDLALHASEHRFGIFVLMAWDRRRNRHSDTHAKGDRQEVVAQQAPRTVDHDRQHGGVRRALQELDR